MARPAVRQVLPDPHYIFMHQLYMIGFFNIITHAFCKASARIGTSILSTKYENFVWEGEGKMPKRVRCETNAVCLSLSLTNPEDEKCIMKLAEQENTSDYAGCCLEECCSREQTHLRVRTKLNPTLSPCTSPNSTQSNIWKQKKFSIFSHPLKATIEKLDHAPLCHKYCVVRKYLMIRDHLFPNF